MTSSKITTKSRVITKKNVGNYESWRAPKVQSGSGGLNRGYMTAEDIEKIQQQAGEEGYRAGFAKGLADGQSEIISRCKKLDSILTFLSEPLEDIDEQVNQQVFQLAMSVAGHIIRREIRSDPGQVIAVVRAAMNALPVSERDVRVYLHPEDVALVKEALSISDEDVTDTRPWRVIEDPVLTRGGCRVRSENSTVDASVEARLNRVIAALLGGDRGDDAGSSNAEGETRGDDDE